VLAAADEQHVQGAVPHGEDDDVHGDGDRGVVVRRVARQEVPFAELVVRHRVSCQAQIEINSS
jgi:hypothetical protein